MPFKPGQSGNSKGRPKDKIYSFALRQQISNYCEENLSYFLQELKGMRSGKAKIDAFLTLLNYALPKLTESNSSIDIENLTAEQIEKLFKTLTNEARK